MHLEIPDENRYIGRKPDIQNPTKKQERKEVLDLPGRWDIVKNVRQKGKKVAAVFPIHYPRELLQAHGIHPVEIFGPPGWPTQTADRHFQSYTCAIVRRGFSFLHEKVLSHVDLVVVPHSCDALQGMASVLMDFTENGKPVLTFYLPRSRRKEDEAFLVNELRRFFQALTPISGRIPEEAELKKAIRLNQHVFGILEKLWEEHVLTGWSNLEFFRLLRAREYLPAEDFLRYADTAPSHFRRIRPKGRILLSGIVPEPMDLLHLLDELGLLVVADDLACSSRRVYRNSDLVSDAFPCLAQCLMAGPPDPTRGDPIKQRFFHLVKLAQKHRAGGILFFLPKFCEPELFDIPLLTKMLQDEGLATLVLESELESSLSQQMVTRLEAFAELVADRTEHLLKFKETPA